MLSLRNSRNKENILGQKVDPRGFRLGYNKEWLSNWMITEKKDFAENLYEDFRIRRYIKNFYRHAVISHINIEKRDKGNSIIINIHAEKPGYLIGKGGGEIDSLIKNLEYDTGKKVSINIMEIQKPDLDAQIMAQRISMQIERRIFFRRAMNEAAETAIEAGALGVKVILSGRLGGAEMSRRDKVQKGNIPLNTLKAEISYGFTTAKTKTGSIGVKVWIYTGHMTKREFTDKLREKEIIKKEDI
jgi:small subunit ribosomal protein S3